MVSRKLSHLIHLRKNNNLNNINFKPYLQAEENGFKETKIKSVIFLKKKPISPHPLEGK